MEDEFFLDLSARPRRNRRFFSQDFLFTRSWGNDCMRTTMIGPNYRWRGRARDVLVSPSRRCSHSAILSLSSSRSPFCLPSRLPSSFASEHEVRLCCVQACVFLGRCIHAFSSSSSSSTSSLCLTACARCTAPPRLRLSPPARTQRKLNPT